MQKNEREEYLDIAKGVGIILVVWAHAQGPLRNFIDGFHMPFFFFVSGMLYRGESRDIGEYCKRKFNSLLRPFYIWNLLFLPLFFVLYYWKQWELSVFLKLLFEIIFTIGKVPFLGATWFLPALFWISCIVHIFLKIIKNEIGCVALLLIGVITTSVALNITFPYRISRTLICSFFYILGYLYKRYLKTRISFWGGNIICAISILGFVIIILNYTSSLSSNIYESKIAYIVGALCGTLSLLYFSKIMTKLFGKDIIARHIAFLGANSIYIVIWQFLAFRFAILLQIVLCDVKVSALTAYPVYDTSNGWWVVYTLCGVYGSVLIGLAIVFTRKRFYTLLEKRT